MVAERLDGWHASGRVVYERDDCTLSCLDVSMTGVLFVVATPIGNLEDITLRAIRTLKEVDWIAAEDTRHSRFLLQHYNIQTPTLSLHEHNEQARANQLLIELRAGKNVALISDAGTPLISDPGYHLVKILREQKISVVPIPGACAAIAALSVAGLPTNHFVFEGFLPAKGAVRTKRLQLLATELRTIVFYESVHRIVDFLELACAVLGADRYIVIAREMTKTFETIQSGTAVDLLEWVKHDPNQQKGEFVLIVSGSSQDIDEEKAKQKRVLEILLQEVSIKTAVDLAKNITGGKHKELYALALRLNEEKRK